MIIRNINGNTLLELDFGKNNDYVFDTHVMVKLHDPGAWAGLSFESFTYFGIKDLQYIIDSYTSLHKREIVGFGMTTFDKVFNIWVKRCGSELVHEIELNDTRYDSPYRCKFKMKFTTSDSFIPNNLYESIGVQNNAVNRNSNAKYIRPFLITFPFIKEADCNGNFTRGVEIVSPYYRIRRELYSEKEDWSFLKRQIEMMIDKNISAFDITEDFIEIHIQRIEENVSIDGSISVFTWDDDIIFHEQLPVSILDDMYLSLEFI